MRRITTIACLIAALGTPLPASAAHPTPDAVLDFWFGDSLDHGWPVVPRKSLWFGSDPAVDEAREYHPRLKQFLMQGIDERVTLADSLQALEAVLQPRFKEGQGR